eukprot:COSAG02_NODE_1485_length_12370_cov_6.022144_7_plen_551_part_00
MRPLLLSCAAAATAVLVAVVTHSDYAVQELARVHTAESEFAHSEALWGRAMETTSKLDLKVALRGYQAVLERLVLVEDGGLLLGLLRAFAQWLAEPLRLRCLHRVAAAHELLREDPVAIVAAHAELLRVGYCEAVIAEAFDATDSDRRRQQEACIAPIARGMVLYAASAAERDAAFVSATTAWRNADSSPVLRWKTRWQMPDHFVPGLRAQPWWPDLPAATALKAEAQVLSREFSTVLASVGGAAGFQSRRTDAWIPLPRKGWGMLPLAAHCMDAKRTCELVEELRGSVDLSGTGYYRLSPGAQLQMHSGPTNERLTCHLTLSGAGAQFTVGGEQREWRPGEAFCFDDSYLHEAVHEGQEDRSVLVAISTPQSSLLLVLLSARSAWAGGDLRCLQVRALGRRTTPRSFARDSDASWPQTLTQPRTDDTANSTHTLLIFMLHTTHEPASTFHSRAPGNESSFFGILGVEAQALSLLRVAQLLFPHLICCLKQFLLCHILEPHSWPCRLVRSSNVRAPVLVEDELADISINASLQTPRRLSVFRVSGKDFDE